MKLLNLASEPHTKEDNPSTHKRKIENAVTARWIPDEACRPRIDEGPAFYPTNEEFEDSVGYVRKIRQEAERYGICKIVPPESWVHHSPKRKDLWIKNFWTRIQPIYLLQNRAPMINKSKGKKRKRGKQSKKKTANSGSEANVASKNYKFGFSKGSKFTLTDFQQFASLFKKCYFRLNDAKYKPSVEEIEGEYWRIIENPTDEVEVHYGNDIVSKDLGVRCGFPKTPSITKSHLDQYVRSGWNLNNFPRLPGSALRFEQGDISGVSAPWTYIGMCFSTFCWHVEDHHLYSLNYVHWGAPKVWYGVPGSYAAAMENAMRKHLPHLFDEDPNLLNELVTMLSPSILKSEGVPVYRIVQEPGEFVITFPRAYHGGFNSGFNIAEAVNAAPFDWFEHGQNAVELYSVQLRKTSLSHDKLLLESAGEAVQALAELILHGKENSKDFNWKSVCGEDGVLTKALKKRITMERDRLCFLPSNLTMRRMDSEFDSSEERECFSCLYDLHLSAVGCQCSPNRYSCLKHSKLVCSCEMEKRIVLFRYTVDELSTLVEALEGKTLAIEEWVNRKTEMVPSVEKVCNAARKEQDNVESRAAAIAALEKDFSSLSGVNLQMPRE